MLVTSKNIHLQNCDSKESSNRWSLESKDHFIVRDGKSFAGLHLLIDLWDAKYLNDLEYMEEVMNKCVEECQATLLHIHLHRFAGHGGISGVAVLAESHISVHTWPERQFAAFDVFMCGDAIPENAIAILNTAFCPSKIDIKEKHRGAIST